MNWASLGQTTVLVILGIVAAYLYWMAVRWCADALYISDMRAQERVSQKTLLEVAEYLEGLDNKHQRQVSEWDEAQPFALDPIVRDHDNRVEDFDTTPPRAA